MSRTEVRRTIHAPVNVVFDAVAHIERFREAVPEILKVEFLTEQKRGVGTRFRETRQMGRRQSSTELEVTEYEPGQRIRLVANQGGTIWDTVFTTVGREDGVTELAMVMDARAFKILARVLNPLIKGMVRKAIESDMDGVKRYCESSIKDS